MDAIDAGLRETTNGRVDHRYIIDVVRNLGPEIGMEMIREVERHPVDRVVGIGLGGSEDFPAEDSAAIYEYAGAIGLRKTAHAGEGRGPDSIWGAIRSLKVERIDHGVRSREDPALMEYLAEHKMPLNLCPTSNVMLGVVPSLEEHPFRFYHERCIPVNAGTDDPTFFKVSLTEELSKLIHYQGFRPEEIPLFIENAIQASFLEHSAKQSLLTRFGDEIRALTRESPPSGEA
ncbi:MAG: adenosine deaminase, partial [bacterium]